MGCQLRHQLWDQIRIELRHGACWQQQWIPLWDHLFILLRDPLLIQLQEPVADQLRDPLVQGDSNEMSV